MPTASLAASLAILQKLRSASLFLGDLLGVTQLSYLLSADHGPDPKSLKPNSGSEAGPVPALDQKEQATKGLRLILGPPFERIEKGCQLFSAF